MATRKDLLKAQSFTSRRMIAAFVDRDPDDPTPPLRRVGTASFVSVLVGVVLLAGTTLLGLLGGGTANDSWKNEDNVILSDTKSGALFVHINKKLIPVADVATARLLAAGENPTGEPRVIEVKTEALRGVTQEPEAGIPGAPRQLPAAKDLASYPVRLCSTAPQSNRRYLTLEFDAEAPGGDGYAFVAVHSTGMEYLLYGGRAHRLYAAPGQRSALVPNLPRVKPNDSWISALPLGEPIVPGTVAGFDNDGGDGYRIGSFAKVEDGEHSRYYINLTDGFSRISYLDMKAIQEAHDTGSRDPVILSDSDIVRLASTERPTFSTESIPMDEPQAPPGFTTTLEDVSVCATYTGDSPDRVALSVDQRTPEMPSNAPAPLNQYIDKVTLPTLSGALLRGNEAVTDAGASTLLLNGKGYSIPTQSDRMALGYGDVTPLSVPAGLIDLLPPGLTIPGNALTRSMLVSGN